jgi:hypothetical protein
MCAPNVQKMTSATGRGDPWASRLGRVGSPGVAEPAANHSVCLNLQSEPRPSRSRMENSRRDPRSHILHVHLQCSPACSERWAVRVRRSIASRQTHSDNAGVCSGNVEKTLWPVDMISAIKLKSGAKAECGAWIERSILRMSYSVGFPSLCSTALPTPQASKERFELRGAKSMCRNSTQQGGAKSPR